MILEDLVARTLLPALFGLLRYLFLVANGMVFTWRLLILNTLVGGAMGYVSWNLLPDNQYRDSIQAAIGIASWEILDKSKAISDKVINKFFDSSLSPKDEEK